MNLDQDDEIKEEELVNVIKQSKKYQSKDQKPKTAIMLDSVKPMIEKPIVQETDNRRIEKLKQKKA